MIRNVIMLTFRSGTTPEQIHAMTSAMDALDCAGLVSRSFGMDLGLREGNMSAVLVTDFVSEDASHDILKRSEGSHHPDQHHGRGEILRLRSQARSAQRL